MKKVVLGFGLAVVMALAGCGGSDSASGGDVGGTFVKELTHIADVLETVKDEDSARAAAHEMDRANMTLKTMVDRINGMTEMEKVMMVQKHAMEMAQVETRISQAVQNIVSNDPKLMDIISNEMQNMPQLE